MGNACASLRSIDRSNECDAETISGYNKNFCTANVRDFIVPRSQAFCRSIGDNEWYPDFTKSYSCNYNSATEIDRFDTTFGCCSIACSIFGRGYDCLRTHRRGRPKICCFKDKACKGINGEDQKKICYDSDTGLRSCPLDAQDMASDTCRAIIQDECSNLNGDPNSQWRANWLTNRTITDTANPGNTGGGGTSTEDLTYTTPNNPICLHALYRNVYGINGFGCLGNAPPTVESGIQPPVNTDGFAFGRKMVEDLFTTYIASGGNIAARQDQEADTEMNDLLFSICSTIPGICASSLQQICSTVTTADLIANPNYQKYCSCYMAPAQYATYTDLYGITKECTPVCNQKGVVGVTEADGITLRKCAQSTCVIDNVSIDLYKSKINGPLNFSQLCGNCGQGANTGVCSCTLRNLTFKAAEATINGGIAISQQCSGESSCSFEKTGADGKVTKVSAPCSGAANYTPGNTVSNTASAQAAAEKWRRTKILLLFIVAIIILIVIFLIFAPRGGPVEDTRIYARTRAPPVAKIPTAR